MDTARVGLRVVGVAVVALLGAPLAGMAIASFGGGAALGGVELLGLTGVVAFVAVGVVLVARIGGSAAAAGRWADRRGLDTHADPEAVRLLARYLARTRAWRTAGALLGAAGLPWLTVAMSPATRTDAGWALSAVVGALVGYALGTLTVELRLDRPTEPVRALRHRTVADYLDTGIRAGARGTLALAGLLAFVALVGGDTRTAGAAGLALVLVAAIVLEGATRLVVARPQRIASGALLAADDAVRRSSVHGLAGTAWALGVAVLGSVLEAMATAGPIVLLAAVLHLLVPGTWLGLGSGYVPRDAAPRVPSLGPSEAADAGSGAEVGA
ncbi:MAG: hypothetical protein ACLGIR_14430 [Actinomycetes bacterium]